MKTTSKSIMKFVFLGLLVVVLFISNTMTQEAQAIGWEKNFGGEGDDEGYSVRQTNDGGYIIVGYAESYGDYMILGSTLYHGNGSYDIYLIKTDAAGNAEWVKTIGGEDIEEGYSVMQTSDGGYIVAGKTTSYGTGNDVYLVKTDPYGDVEWQKTYKGEGGGVGRSVRQTTDGGYIIAGYTDDPDGYGYDVYLIKTDANGNIEWEKTYGGEGDDEGYSVRQTTDGGYIVVGSSESYGNGSSDVYLIKTDASGNVNWVKTIGGESDDYGYSVRQTTDGGYIIAGTTFSDGNYIITNTTLPHGNGNYDIYLIKTDSTGNAKWVKAIGGDDDDYGYSVEQTTDDGYIIAGYTGSYGNGSSDVYLIKTDANGNVEWEKTYGGDYEDRGRSVQQTTDGGYIIAGYTESYVAGQGFLFDIYFPEYSQFEESHSGGERNVYLIKTYANGNVEWQKTFWGGEGYSVQQTNDDGYIIACDGEHNLIKIDAVGNFDAAGDVMLREKTYSGYQSRSVQQTTDGGYIVTGKDIYEDIVYVYLIKIDASGNVEWDKIIGREDDYDKEGDSIQQTSDGGYIIAGYTESYGAGRRDVYLIKTDANGNIEWQKTFGGEDNDVGRSVQQTTDGGYIIAGSTYSYGNGYSDVYLIKTDANGDIEWDKIIGGIDSDFGYSVQQTTDGGYIIAGSTYSYGAGRSDVFLIKTDANGNIE